MLAAPAIRTVLTASPATASSTARADDRRRGQRRLVPPGELAEAIPRRRRAGLHRLVVQVALDVGRQAVGRLVAAVAVLLQAPSSRSSPARRAPACVSLAGSVCRLAAIDGSVSLERAQPRARLGRLLLADDPQHLVERRLLAAAFARTASCRSAARTAARPANRCRCGCRCRAG